MMHSLEMNCHRAAVTSCWHQRWLDLLIHTSTIILQKQMMSESQLLEGMGWGADHPVKLALAPEPKSVEYVICLSPPTSHPEGGVLPVGIAA